MCDGKNTEVATNGGRSWEEAVWKDSDLQQDLPLQEGEVVLEENRVFRRKRKPAEQSPAGLSIGSQNWTGGPSGQLT